MSWRCEGLVVGLVPTMGALHRGHLALIAAARQQCDRVVVSIFVNPLQFGPGEDYHRYPRDLGADFALLETCGVEAIYHPAVADVYPQGFATSINVQLRGLESFEGSARPGHFQGVATVIAKLFSATGPARAFFGEKDAQQALLVVQLAQDLDGGVEVVVLPTVRDHDGLALSSRNAYLRPAQRRAALSLSRWLRDSQARFAAGERSAAVFRDQAQSIFASAPAAALEYADAVDSASLVRVEYCTAASRLLVAARVGSVRLIDTALLGGPPVL